MRKIIRNIFVILSVIAAVAVSNYLSYRHSAKSAGLIRKPAASTEDRKILFYRNPMTPEVTSPVPTKDSMGMDYVPVYEEQKTASPSGQGVFIPAEKQQLVGIKTETVGKRRLVNVIRAAGKVAYDPDLFLAQEEYLAALKVKDQAADILAASEKKLLLMGMSPDEIKALAERGTSQESLYLPSTQNTSWVYASVYEYDMASVKEGMPASVEAVAFPGETFKGKVIAITPVLDAQTRSVQARIEVQDPDHKLKPDMYANVTFSADLGQVLAVPEETVMDTGVRTLVFVVKPDGYFETRPVVVGRKAQGYEEILSGLKEGEEVVTDGNFFVDSESKLKI